MNIIKSISIRSLYKITGLGILVLLVIYSCKNDYETINALTSELSIPDQTGYDVEIMLHDSGYLKGKIIAPEVNKYNRVDEPYIEFPKGLKVYFYDPDQNEEKYVQAEYAIYYQRDEFWELRNEVVAENLITGEKLETDQLFWDQENEVIFSEKFSKITNEDGIFYGENGFDASQDLTHWTLKGSKGTAIVTEEQSD